MVFVMIGGFFVLRLRNFISLPLRPGGTICSCCFCTLALAEVAEAGPEGLGQVGLGELVQQVQVQLIQSHTCQSVVKIHRPLHCSSAIETAEEYYTTHV